MLLNVLIEGVCFCGVSLSSECCGFVIFVIPVRTIQVQNVRSLFWDMNVLIQGVGFCGVSLSSECDGCCGFV